MLLRRRPPTILAPETPACVTDMNAPLLQLSPMEEDYLSLNDCFEGIFISGRSGSGKSSGSGASVAKAMLRSGASGLVLAAKPDEPDVWERYAAETGRSADVIRMDGSGRYRFNFLEYEMQRDDLATDVLVSNLVSTIQAGVEAAGRATGLDAGNRGDIFWQKAPRTMLMRAIDLLYATTGRVRLGEIVDLIESAPLSKEMAEDETWQRNSFFAEIFRVFHLTKGGVNPPAPTDFERLKRYWLQVFPTLPERTRGNVLMTLQTDLEDLLRPALRKIFCTDTNVVPEMTHDGKIWILDFPILQWNEAGVLAQLITKYAWMRSTQRRKVDADTRPVFLWADECQLFLSSYDMEFQSTARSSRTATVLMTQNLPSFYSRIGGQNPEHTVNAMMGNLRTKIFHNNDCTTTNEWAAKIVGKTSVWRRSFNTNSGWNQGYSDNFSDSRNTGHNEGKNSSYNTSFGSSSGGGVTSSGGNSFGGTSGSSYGESQTYSQGQSGGVSGGQSAGVQEERDYAVEPHEFATTLRTGGPANDRVVDGVVVLPGRTFARNGKHWMTVGFKQ